MRLSRERLLADSASSGFRAEILEKVIHLLGLLEGFARHPMLQDKLALKGGTALNLFIFNLPRLSVDLDLNYVGQRDRDLMLAEKPKAEKAIAAVCSREGFVVRRVPDEHAGGKWRLRYDGALGQVGNLEIDLNYMLRTPLWPILPMDSRAIGSAHARQIPVTDINEVAAGKLAALLSRHAARDVFDVHQILRSGLFDPERLRLGFVVYGAMNRRDWRTVSADNVGFDEVELANTLVPVLRTSLLESIGDRRAWAARLVEECRQALGAVLPLHEAECEFLNRLLDHGEIEPALLTGDPAMAEHITHHPGLHWKALNVREFRGL